MTKWYRFGPILGPHYSCDLMAMLAGYGGDNRQGFEGSCERGN